MEQFAKTIPVVTPAKSTTNYKVIFVGLWWELPQIIIHLRGENDEVIMFKYGGIEPTVTPADKDIALQMMIGLNKANLSIKSLHRRIIERLISDGLIVGSVIGAPD